MSTTAAEEPAATTSGGSGSGRMPLHLRAARRVTALILRHLRSSPRRGLAETIRAQEVGFDRGVLVIRAFYAVSFMWTVHTMGSWIALRDIELLEPLWPAWWLDSQNPRTGVTFIVYGYLAASLAGMCFPRSRLARISYVVFLAQYLAINMGFGKINHNFHGWLWTSAIFVFLPTVRGFRRGDSATRHQTLSTIWTAQLVVLFFYTLTGLWKVGYSLRALTTSAVSGFEIDGFSLILADRIMRTNQQTLLGDWLLQHPLPGWFLYNGTMYLESASILVAFRPRLHRLWGVGLIVFHLGTQLAMGFTFSQNLVLLGLLFLCSPFAPDDVDVRRVLTDLPGIHLATRLWARRPLRS